jgi:hypothetical protein
MSDRSSMMGSAAAFAAMTDRPTARQILEARLGRKLPATRDLPRDLRVAIKSLAIQLIRSNP